MKIAMLSMNGRELARSDIAGGFAEHLERQKKFNPTPSAVEASGKLWIMEIGRKLDALASRVEFDRVLGKLETECGAEGKSAALEARVELLESQLEARRRESQAPRMETLDDVLEEL